MRLKLVCILLYFVSNFVFLNVKQNISTQKCVCNVITKLKKNESFYWDWDVKFDEKKGRRVGAIYYEILLLFFIEFARFKKKRKKNI